MAHSKHARPVTLPLRNPPTAGAELRGEDDFSGLGAVDHRREAIPRFRQGNYPVNEGTGAGLLAEAKEAAELVTGAHRGANDRQLGEKDPRELGRRDVAAGSAEIGRASCRERV